MPKGVVKKTKQAASKGTGRSQAFYESQIRHCKKMITMKKGYKKRAAKASKTKIEKAEGDKEMLDRLRSVFDTHKKKLSKKEIMVAEQGFEAAAKGAKPRKVKAAVQVLAPLAL
jgi:hypothetical protein